MISLMRLARFDPIFLPYLFASADDEMAILRSGEHGRSKEGRREEGNESAIDVDDSRDTTGQGTNKL